MVDVHESISGRAGRRLLAPALVIVAAATICSAEPAPPATPGPLLSQALAGPWKGTESLVFCTRSPYSDGHWYANIGYYCDDENHKAYAGNGKPDDGKLCLLDLRTGAVKVLLDAKGGSVRDPQVSYDGRRILFSHRPAGTDFYHLYEIGADGSGLRRLTDGPFDDYEPIYLPDDDIVFVSTRCKRWVNCWMTQVGTLYRCGPDGGRIESISPNTEHDNTPWLLPDGRLLYTRWEYVDRSQVEYHGLWTMNPDGTAAAAYFGNLHSWTVMIDAKPIPGTQRIVASFSPGHGANEHAGIATVLSQEKGPDDVSVPRPLHKGVLTRDPYALSEHVFMVARNKQVLLVDGAGHEEAFYTYAGPGNVHEPRPVAPRPREPVVAPRVRPGQATGRFFLSNVCDGRNLPGVQRGEVRKLLVLESLPKPVNFSGGMDLLSWLGSFTLERVLGTVPVESDGSAYFEAPALRQLFFVALDGADLSVKRMQSFTSVMPGETLGCVGCHEERTQTPQNIPGTLPLALRREPSRIESFAGQPDVLDFPRDIQPILDRHCLSCHNPDDHKGGLNLTGDLADGWSIAYFSLFARRQVADGRNGLGNQPPRTLGSSASALLRKVDGSHHDVKVMPAERLTLWMWIESGAPFTGSYAGLRNAADQNLAGRAQGTAFGGAGPVLQKRCASCHTIRGGTATDLRPMPLDQEKWRKTLKAKAGRPTGAYERMVAENDPAAHYAADVLLDFTRPECSAILRAPLAKSAGGWESCGPPVFTNRDDPDYKLMLAAIERGRDVFGSAPRYGRPGFRPNRQYIREMKRFGILPADFDEARAPVDIFDTDRRYWESMWCRPSAPPSAVAGP